jgi:UDP-GlcNAc:undecaprenyl-phosphate GlcNAc-1-phosphate transferase
MGMTNAMNHSDGLDGLAGGEAILSLVAIGFLAFLSDGSVAVLIAVAVIGGVFGFLRYNTHPAAVFMGDSGSQVIGFSLGVLAVLLTQRVDTTLSPAVVVLLLGLPIADILYVFYRRIREGRNWFRATKNHVHHRLMERRFLHPEAVVIIYAVQISFVASGLLLRHASDWLLAGIYLGGCTVVFGGLFLAEKYGWYAPAKGEERGNWRWLGRGKRKQFVLVALPRRFLEIVIPAYLVIAAATVGHVPEYSARIAFGLLCALGATLITVSDARSVVRRALLFCVGGLVVHLSLGQAAASLTLVEIAERAFFGVAAAAVLVAIRYSPGRRGLTEFRTTSMDYLIVLVMIVALLATGPIFDASIASLGALFVMLYAMELLITERRRGWLVLEPAAVAALLIVAVRGFV